MNRRAEQLASEVQRAVQEVLARGLNDPRVGGLITVTGVKVDDDRSVAIVSVSVLPEEKEELTLHGLKAAAAYVRRQVGELVRTRSLPPIEFRLDRSLKRQAAVIRDLAKIDEERSGRETPEEAERGVPLPPGQEPGARGEGGKTKP